MSKTQHEHPEIEVAQDLDPSKLPFAKASVVTEPRVDGRTATAAISESTQHLSQGLLAYLSDAERSLLDDMIDRRKRQIQYMLMYLAALGTLLGVAAYALDTETLASAEQQFGYAIFGLVVWSFVFGAGICLIHFLGHNFRRIIIARKNVACLRAVATRVASSHPAVGRSQLFCDGVGLKAVKIPGSYARAHYWMLGPNFAVAFGGCLPFLYWLFHSRAVDSPLTHAVQTAACFIAVASGPYPMICVSYVRHLTIAAFVRTGIPESKAFDKYYKELAARINRKRWRPLFFMYITFACLAILASVLSLLVRVHYQEYASYADVGFWVTVGCAILAVLCRFLQIRNVYRPMIEVTRLPGQNLARV